MKKQFCNSALGTPPVLSVNDKTGHIILEIGDIPKLAGELKKTSDELKENARVVKDVQKGLDLEIARSISEDSLLNGKIDSLTLEVNTHGSNTNNPHSVTKEQIGLGNVDNTSDLNKPISTAVETRIVEAESKIQNSVSNHEKDTLNPHKVTKTQVGLGNVDNTSDLDKPVSIATSAEIVRQVSVTDSKINGHLSDLSNPHFVTKEQIGLGNVDNTNDLDKPISIATRSLITAEIREVEDEIVLHTSNLSNPHRVTKEQIGLELVDNTSDLDKPISTAVDKKFNSVAGQIDVNRIEVVQHISDLSNPHAVTKEQVGLGNVDNTSDINKPLSAATYREINLIKEKHVLDTDKISEDMALKADKDYVDEKLSSISGGLAGSYLTLALAEADKANIPANSTINITNDPTPSKNGQYTWDGVKFTKSEYDPLSEAKTYTDEEIAKIPSFPSTVTEYMKDKEDDDTYLYNSIYTRVPERSDLLYRTNRQTGFPTVDKVYEVLDALELEYSEYLTSKVLGEIEGLPIKQYTLRAATLANSNTSVLNDWPDKSPLKGVIISGMHGDEKESVISWVTFFYELVIKWKEDELLSEIRTQSSIVYIPVLNPTGFNTNTRNNFNDVDLNRNFPNNWIHYSSGIAGAAPLDQKEAQIVFNLPSEHPDASFFIDGHDMYPITVDNVSYWLGAYTEKLKDIGMQISREAGALLSKKYNVLDGVDQTSRFSRNANATAGQSWSVLGGVDAFLVEIPRAEQNANIWKMADRRSYSRDAITLTVSRLVTWYRTQKALIYPLTLEVKDTQRVVYDLSNSNAKKLSVDFEFYSYKTKSLPSFFYLTEDFKVIEVKDTKDSNSFKFDFYSAKDQDNFLFLSSDFRVLNGSPQGEVIPPVNTNSFKFDFYSAKGQDSFLFLTSDFKILNTTSQGGLGDLPETEFTDSDYYLNSRVVTQVRKDYPDYYYKTSQETISHADDIYAFYDKLMSENPEYITRELLGNDTEGYPMYTYIFTPIAKHYWGHSKEDVAPPLFVINSGIHGAEKMGIIAAMSFFDNLVNNWRSEPLYDKLRFSCKFVITPACNPYGTKMNKRGNINGVDLNRNFDSDWAEASSSDPASVNYKGTHPFSEVESTLLATIPDKYPGAQIYLDLHQQGETYLFWFGTILEETKKLTVDALDEMITYVHKDVNPTGDINAKMGRLAYNGEATAARYYQKVKGVPTVLIEMSSSNHPMLPGGWLEARVVAEKSVLTLVQKAYEKYLRT